MLGPGRGGGPTTHKRRTIEGEKCRDILSSSEKLSPVIKNLKMGGNEDVFQQLKVTPDRTIDQILSGILGSDHVDVMCGVVELIEGHTEEEVKYSLGKMCLVLTRISTVLKTIQGAPDLQQVLQHILPNRSQRLL